ncbi:MAG: hypothetical protein PQJ59_05280 [Spirochaetales bacterium]|nr:hypothetical protein [Spirochaetales bacterium]
MEEKKVYSKPEIKTETIVLGVFGDYNQSGDQNTQTGIGGFLAGW